MKILYVFKNTAQAKCCFVISHSTDDFLLLTIFFRRQFKASEEKNIYFYSPAIKNRIWEDFLNLAFLLQVQKAFFISQLNDSVTLLSSLREQWRLLFIFYVQYYVHNTCLKELAREAWYSSHSPREIPSLSRFHWPSSERLPSTVPCTSLPLSSNVPLHFCLPSKSCLRWERLWIELGVSTIGIHCCWWCILMMCESHTKVRKRNVFCVHWKYFM